MNTSTQNKIYEQINKINKTDDNQHEQTFPTKQARVEYYKNGGHYVDLALASYYKFIDETVPSSISKLVDDLVTKQRTKAKKMREMGIKVEDIDSNMIESCVNTLVYEIARPARAYGTPWKVSNNQTFATSLSGIMKPSYQAITTLVTGVPDAGDTWITKLRKWREIAVAANTVDKDFINSEMIDWSIATAQLAMNPSIANMFLSLVRQLNRIFKMDLLTEHLFRYVREAFSSLMTKLGSTQPTTDPYVDNNNEVFATALNESTYSYATKFINMINDAGDSAGVIASVLASIVVTVVTAVMGRDILKSSDSKPLLKKLGELGMSLSGCKRGVDALKCMIGEVEAWMREAVSYIVGKDIKNSLMVVISDWDIEDDGEFEKCKVFEHVEYLLNPINYDAVRANESKRQLLLRVTGFLQSILHKHAITPIGITRAQCDLIQRYVNDLKVLRMSAYRYSNMPITRFTPMWINLYGDPGTGKSTFMTRCCELVLNALWKKGDFGVPSADGDDPRVFPMNFCDDYMTGYCGQYAVTIDDVFQDTGAAASASNSAYKMISLVSNTPYRTVQAAVEDKGLPFDSKIIWSTSNVRDLNRKEIVSQGALMDRITVNVHMRFKKETCADCRKRNATICARCERLVDPILGKPVEIVLLELDDTKTYFKDASVFPSAEEFTWFVFKRYLAWWKHQHYVMSLPQADKELTDKICSRVQQEDEVHATGFFGWLEGTIGNPLLDYPVEEVDGVKFLSMAGPKITKCGRDLDPIYLNRTFANAILAGLTQFDDIRYWLIDGNGTRCRLATEQANYNQKCAQAWDKFVSNTAGKAVLAIFAGLSSWYLLRSLSGSSSNASVDQVFQTSMKYAVSRPVRLKPTKGSTRSKPPVAYATGSDEAFPVGADPSGEAMIEMMYERGSLGNIKLVSNERFSIGVMTRIKGPYILTNHHFFRTLVEGDELEISYSIRGNVVKINQVYEINRMTRVGDKDLAVYKCDERMMAAKDILHHFQDDSVDLHMHMSTVLLPHVILENYIAKPDIVPSSYVSHDGENQETYVQIESWSIKRSAVKGQSGCMLISRDPRLSARILGIQTCGSNLGDSPRSFFSPVSKQELEEAMEVYHGIEIPDVEATCLHLGVRESVPSEYTAQGSLLHLGNVHPANAIRQTTKTKILKSAVHDDNNTTHQTAILDSNDERLGDNKGVDLIAKNMAGYDKVSGKLRMREFARAFTAICTIYITNLVCIGIPRRVLSEFEMINGIFSYLNPFDMRTSPGFPWVKHRKEIRNTGKFEWFDVTVQNDGSKTYMMKQELRDVVTLRENEAKKGRRIESASYACLKDETRKTEKIKAGKTRVFVCMPMDFNLLVRKYFGSFVATMHANAGALPPCVGLDPGSGWTGLVKRLQSVGPYFEDFDYGSWDTSLHPELFRAFARCCNKWYGDDDDSDNGRVRIVLMHEVVFTYIIAGKRLLLKTTGNCSGCAVTAELNSFIGDLLMMYFWFCTAPKEFDIDFYLENVALAIYGDDVVKSVSYEARFFDGNVIKPIALELGMMLTDGSKNAGSFEYKNVGEVTFLKRGFKKDGNYWRAPLDKTIVENIPQWVHSSDDIFVASEVNCETALREAAQFGREYYEMLQCNLNKRIGKLNEICGEVVMKPRCNDYSYYILE